MGENTDYYKPKAGETLCSALKSNNKFLWSATQNGNYIAPSPYHRHSGGSLGSWPKNNVPGDNRAYLPFWSYASGSVSAGTNGCCHNTKTDQVKWGRSFKIYVTPLRFVDMTGQDCSKFDQHSGWIVVMGENTDYYKPKAGETLCSALKSNNKFLWSATQNGNYIAPSPYPSHLGGSASSWPKNNVPGDNRVYLPFWGHPGSVSAGTNGCCHNTKTDQAKWGRSFKIYATPLSYRGEKDKLDEVKRKEDGFKALEKK